MKYESYFFKNKNDVVEKLESGLSKDIIAALIGAVKGIDDCKWLQELCLKYTNHPDYWVAKTAIISLGDIGRIHKHLDVNRIKKELDQIDNSELESTIKDTLDDIWMFVIKGNK